MFHKGQKGQCLSAQCAGCASLQRASLRRCGCQTPARGPQGQAGQHRPRAELASTCNTRAQPILLGRCCGAQGDDLHEATDAARMCRGGCEARPSMPWLPPSGRASLQRGGPMGGLLSLDITDAPRAGRRPRPGQPCGSGRERAAASPCAPRHNETGCTERASFFPGGLSCLQASPRRPRLAPGANVCFHSSCAPSAVAAYPQAKGKDA